MVWGNHQNLTTLQNALYLCSTHKGENEDLLLFMVILCPIVATAHLDLLHVDFKSIETILGPNQSPRVTNVLVFQDHFTKHVLAYMTPDQAVKTVAKFLYGGYISYLWGPSQALE